MITLSSLSPPLRAGPLPINYGPASALPDPPSHGWLCVDLLPGRLTALPPAGRGRETPLWENGWHPRLSRQLLPQAHPELQGWACWWTCMPSPEGPDTLHHGLTSRLCKTQFRPRTAAWGTTRARPLP